MPANRVTAQIGYTIAMGDFEFMRFDFGVETDVNEDETTRQAMDRAKALVENVLGEEIKKAHAVKGPLGKVTKSGGY